MAELSTEDKDFLAQCEEEFKDRFTEKDEEFMKVFNAEPSVPPILENNWPSNNSRRYDRRNNRRFNPYDRDRYNNRDRRYHERGSSDSYHDRGSGENYSRGYSDYHQDDRSYGNRYDRRQY
ncbi:RNA guanine-N7 methyltransferase activating subunit [Colias croceus]|uniref:RNA guanine-N7 methyltransferase activating subunit n=1 Tax=Colias crocea TaxID=72248 RepID=UPI001E27E7E5|nr:RNA guanine-N7 methyltransferase activating subunit [Colias croceus]